MRDPAFPVAPYNTIFMEPPLSGIEMVAKLFQNQ
jgi:hypothetical protein